MNAQELLDIHDELCNAGKAIMQKKNHDYTSGSEDPFRNFRMSANRGVHPVKGIVTRIDDKISRLCTFVDRGVLQVEDEDVDNSIIDAINYLVLAAAMLREIKQERMEHLEGLDQLVQEAQDMGMYEVPEDTPEVIERIINQEPQPEEELPEKWVNDQPSVPSQAEDKERYQTKMDTLERLTASSRPQ